MYWVKWDFVVDNTRLFALWTIVVGAIIIFGSRVYQSTVVRLWRWVNLR